VSDNPEPVEQRLSRLELSFRDLRNALLILAAAAIVFALIWR